MRDGIKLNYARVEGRHFKNIHRDRHGQCSTEKDIYTLKLLVSYDGQHGLHRAHMEGRHISMCLSIDR
jgi:hypothetical protein